MLLWGMSRQSVARVACGAQAPSVPDSTEVLSQCIPMLTRQGEARGYEALRCGGVCRGAASGRKQRRLAAAAARRARRTLWYA